MTRQLRIHDFMPYSMVNGPGCRSVLWLQGCSRQCPGCFNPGAQPFDGGETVSIDEIYDRITSLQKGIEGISVSGGEPLEQAGPLTELFRRIKADTELSILVFTGYTLDQIAALPALRGFLDNVDVLVAGPFQCGEAPGPGLIGSANQQVHLLTERYQLDGILAVPEVELLVLPGGEIIISGIGGGEALSALRTLSRQAGGGGDLVDRT